MNSSQLARSLLKDIHHNCNISDAKDHGVYSMCTMVLKLRNLYKWEHGLAPWQEPEPADLLDWIESKETYWETIADEQYRPLHIGGHTFPPINHEDISPFFENHRLVYGAGYGRSMKTVFFLAEMVEKKTVAGCPVYILGKEEAKEMASPFAMSQNGIIYLRKESLGYFLWDQIHELQSSKRITFQHALQWYGLMQDGQLNQRRLKQQFDDIIVREMDLFIYHEIGEILETTLKSETLQKITAHYPNSVIELICRSIKDVLADTHPEGLLAYVIREKRESSLSFYIGFLDGLRKNLFPEIVSAWHRFLDNHDWSEIEQASHQCRERNLILAGKLHAICQQIGHKPETTIQQLFNSQIITPLGLDIPQQ